MKPFLSLLILLVSLPCSFSQELKLDKYAGQPQTVTRARVASLSALEKKWDKVANWAHIELMTLEAAGKGGAKIVVTPEGALEGYVINEVNAVSDPVERGKIVQKFIELAEPLDGPYIQKACALAKELKIYFVFGFLEKADDDLHNTVILIDPDGDIVGKYSKTHFAQGYTINPTCYQPGNEYPVFDTPFGKAGILICYDRQQPEPARILALQGAQVLFLPSYGSYDDGGGWNTALLRTRAYENRFPLIFSHPYQSLLIDRHGDIVAKGNANEIVYFDLDTTPDKYKDRFKNRRPETYDLLTK